MTFVPDEAVARVDVAVSAGVGASVPVESSVLVGASVPLGAWTLVEAFVRVGALVLVVVSAEDPEVASARCLASSVLLEANLECRKFD